MKTVLVVAGNAKQFIVHACDLFKESPGGRFNKAKMVLELPDVTYRYIDRPEQMKGFHGVEVRYWGTTFERKDIDKFKQEQIFAEMP